jgi:tetrahydromethanopterin S-methyltransferase subunit F/uncharacterized coiled-coil protein SlyX
MENDQKNKSNPVDDKAKNYIETKAREEGVKKGAMTASIIGFLILLVAGIVFYSVYNKEQKKLNNQMETQKVSLTGQVTARDSVISEWITTFDEIEKNIMMIKEKEKVITLNSSNAEMSKDKKTQVLEDIKYINTLLEQNRKKIASLTAQLQKSGGTIKVLQTKIAGLEASMKQNEAEISELKTALVTKKFEVEQLNTQMVVLNDTLSKKTEKINAQVAELNKAFYSVGTFKELKAKGLLTKEGGFIGIGKKETMTGNFPENSFIQIDVTQVSSIAVDAKSAKLITDHQSGSFEFIKGADKKITSLQIKDPVQFWKVSKYAVIEITK